LISRNLERVGDHATNIAEEVIYWIQGRDVRHSGPEKSKKPIVDVTKGHARADHRPDA
jgi:phosphate uptake regulator